MLGQSESVRYGSACACCETVTLCAKGATELRCASCKSDWHLVGTRAPQVMAATQDAMLISERGIGAAVGRPSCAGAPGRGWVFAWAAGLPVPVNAGQAVRRRFWRRVATDLDFRAHVQALNAIAVGDAWYGNADALAKALDDLDAQEAAE